MNTENRKVLVKSMVNYSVCLTIPELRFKRTFTKEGEVKSIDFDTLYEGMTMRGVRALFEEGILYLDSEQDRIDLGLEEEGQKERFKILNKGQIIKLLKLDIIEKLKETLDTLPKEQINRIAEVAISEKFTDFEKCNLIKKYCGIDIIANVQNSYEEK